MVQYNIKIANEAISSIKPAEGFIKKVALDGYPRR
jgi:hypothetical protein